jgi:DNA polymerase-3 subunit epsilon
MELGRVGRPAFSTQVTKVTDTLLMAREQFPGKSNSLDALCKRLEVDNANRSLHGALLDAGLLAEVYIRMTRGQNALVIDAANERSGGAELAEFDLSALVLAVTEVSDEERQAHEAVLAEIDKASGGKTIWRVAMA